MKTHRTKAEERRAYLLMVFYPAKVLIYFAVVAFPMIFSLWISVSDYSGGQIFGGSTPVRFAGFSNYVRMWNDRYFWISLKNNVYVVLFSVFGQIPLGFILACALYRNMIPGERLFSNRNLFALCHLLCNCWYSLANHFLALRAGYRNYAVLLYRGWQNTMLSNPSVQQSLLCFW